MKLWIKKEAKKDQSKVEAANVGMDDIRKFPDNSAIIKINSITERGIKNPINNASKQSVTVKEDLFHEAYSLEKEGKYYEAIRCYNKKELESPKNVYVKLYKAHCFRNMKEYDNALKTIDKALHLLEYTDSYTFSEASICKGMILGDMGRHNAAMDMYNNLIHFQPNNYRGYEVLIYAYQNLGLYGSATVISQKALQKFPDTKEIISAYVHTEKLKLKKMADCMERHSIQSYVGVACVDVEPQYRKVDVKINEAYKINRGRDKSDALIKINEALSLINENIVLSGLCMDRGTFVRDVGYSILYKAFMCKATILESMDNYVEAIDIYTNLIKYQPNNYDGYNALIVCYQRINRSDLSSGIYIKAIDKFPGNKEVLEAINYSQKLKDEMIIKQAMYKAAKDAKAAKATKVTPKLVKLKKHEIPLDSNGSIAIREGLCYAYNPYGAGNYGKIYDYYQEESPSSAPEASTSRYNLQS